MQYLSAFAEVETPVASLLKLGEWFLVIFFFFKVFFSFVYLYIYFWLCWVFVAPNGISLVAAVEGYSWLRRVGFPWRWLLSLQRTGSWCTGFSSCCTWAQSLQLAGSVVVSQGLSCPTTCGVFQDQGLNQCSPYCKADS